VTGGAGTRQVIVNADDFGRSYGINRGVFAAHEHGIVTSASLMVRWPAARDAVEYARAAPALGLGLHVDLAEWVYAAGEWRALYEVVDPGDAAAVREEVWRQVERFDALYGAYPSHLDSHQHVHRSEPVRSAVLEVGAELGVVLRGEDLRVAYCGDFHGQDGRAQRIEAAITTGALIDIVGKLGAGVTEIACHPGLGDESGSVYAGERDDEVAVLCDPAVRAAIEAAGIRLTTFRELRAGRTTGSACRPTHC
jgi:chitin disaccharide deacetylase